MNTLLQTADLPLPPQPTKKTPKIQNGIETEYHPNGQILRKFPWKDGNPVDWSEGWHSNGNRWYRIHRSITTSTIDQIEEWWYENGQIAFQKDWQTGKVLAWTPDGRMRQSELS